MYGSCWATDTDDTSISKISPGIPESCAFIYRLSAQKEENTSWSRKWKGVQLNKTNFKRLEQKTLIYGIFDEAATRETSFRINFVAYKLSHPEGGNAENSFVELRT